MFIHRFRSDYLCDNPPRTGRDQRSINGCKIPRSCVYPLVHPSLFQLFLPNLLADSGRREGRSLGWVVSCRTHFFSSLSLSLSLAYRRSVFLLHARFRYTNGKESPITISHDYPSMVMRCAHVRTGTVQYSSNKDGGCDGGGSGG